MRDRRTVRLTAAGEISRREALETLRRNEAAVRLTFSISLTDAMRDWLDLLDSSSVEQLLELLVDEGEKMNSQWRRCSTGVTQFLSLPS